MSQQLPPLAERMRPKKINNFIGQDHLLAENSILKKSIAQKNVPSIIFWGPPGTGKTTLAQIIAQSMELPFYTLSAISSGVKEIREIIDNKLFSKTVLFIDEIHRFNKSQQDSLLGAVEKGKIILIGATTENPSFEVNYALLSRMQVYTLNLLNNEEMTQILHRAIHSDEILKTYNIELKENDALLRFANGDARKLLNLVEQVVNLQNASQIIIDNKIVEKVAQQKFINYDKKGEMHYDIISAFIKSIRGSDPNASVYYLARMLEGGEDPKFIARRMVILASEDIGNANPTALVLAHSTFQSIHIIGMPESRIILSQCAIYLACSPKSNASYVAIEKALNEVRKSGDLSVPLEIRNAPTQLMKKLDYGKDYKYAHNFENNFVEMEFLPNEIHNTKFYEPSNNKKEQEMRLYLRERWKEKYGY